MISPNHGARPRLTTTTRQRLDTALNWATRRDQIAVILGGLVLTAFILWILSHVARAMVLLLLASLLAYILMPGERWLRKFVPRWLALLLVYIALIAVIGGLGYLAITTAIQQFGLVAQSITSLFSNGPHGEPSPIIRALLNFGISPSQISQMQQYLISQTAGIQQQVIPVLQSLINGTLDTVLLVVMSIYLLIDGERVTTWLTTQTPEPARGRIRSFLQTLHHVVGGYVRGQFTLSLIIGILVGVGMWILRVPAAIFLGVLAFVLEFIPIVGVFVSGAVCVLLAMTVGWGNAILVLVYFIFVHIIEGEVLGPRIVGRAVGLHPAISIAALIAGADLFGILGALLAAPTAGLIQVVIVDLYDEWHKGQVDTGQPIDLESDGQATEHVGSPLAKG